MAHFKVNLSIGKKGSISRVLHVRAEDAIGAMDIGRKIRYGKVLKVEPITYKEYMIGVHKKYDPDSWKAPDKE
jgi:hypothetical protein